MRALACWSVAGLVAASAAWGLGGLAGGGGGGERIGDPYTLGVCAVEGEPLGEGRAVRVIDGRELRFCCEMCPETFAKDPAKYLEKVDAMLIEAQREHYPLSTCPVGGGALGEKGEPKDVIIGNRLVRLCCPLCEEQARKDPGAIIAKLNEAVIAQQAPAYPLKTCPVSEHELGEMGAPYDVVIGTTLVRLCCDGCLESVEAEPGRYVAMVQEAWAATGKGE